MFRKGRKFNLSYGFEGAFRYSPLYATILVLYNIVTALVPAAGVYINANFIDSALAIVSKNESISTITIPLILLVSILIWNLISSTIMNFVIRRFILQLRERVRAIFLEKRAKIDYKYVEDEESWNLITRAAGSEPENNINAIFGNMLSIFTFIITILSIIYILISKVWWAGVLIAVISIPLILVAMKGGKAGYEANREVTKYQRKYGYLGEILRGRESVEERTLFGFSEKVNDKFKQAFETSRIIEYKTKKKWFIRSKSGSVITSMLSTLVILVLIPYAVNKTLEIGMFIALVNAVLGLINNMSWRLTRLVDTLASQKEYLKDLTTFFDMDEQIGADVVPLKITPEFKTLEFRDVKFKYPKTETYILTGMTFKMESGKHYAFVGVNGAGKTTIAKLLCGLYNEYEGEILINDRDIKEFSAEEIKSYFSAVFQDFARYSISMRENISLGKINGGPDIESEIQEAINIAGLNEAIGNLKNGLDTPLGKIKEEGVDLSGGEWQRVAMARSIINPAPIKILDEPTAALDPVSESKVYNQFEKISQGKTTIFISHRLGSTKLADCIFVLENGKVSESGSHSQLMALNCTYAEMFESQRSWYL